MKVYTLLHIIPDDPAEGSIATVSVYATKEAAKLAMEMEIKNSAEWLRQQYADQPDTLKCVQYNIYDDCGDYGDGIFCERWEIDEHEISATA